MGPHRSVRRSRRGTLALDVGLIVTVLALVAGAGCLIVRAEREVQARDSQRDHEQVPEKARELTPTPGQPEAN